MDTPPCLAADPWAASVGVVDPLAGGSDAEDPWAGSVGVVDPLAMRSVTGPLVSSVESHSFSTQKEIDTGHITVASNMASRSSSMMQGSLMSANQN